MLRSAVQSVLDQTYRPIEVLIADDGSTDETPEVGRSLEADYPGIVRFFRSEANAGSGPGPMREWGRQHANGAFIQYLDSDDRLLPNKFADQVRLLLDRPDVDIAYGYTRLVDAKGNVIADPFKWTGRDIVSLYPGLLVDRWWCTHTPLYRRELADRIGPWSSLRWSQDWEYDARAGALQARTANCHTYVSEHVHHDGVRQTSAADWETDPVRLRNRRDLLTSLWQNAQRAGVSRDAPERQHFARWCFAIARQCASVSLVDEMQCLLSLAEQAAGMDGPGLRGIKTFQRLSRFFGPKIASDLLTIAARWRRGHGAQTLPQSFSRARPN